MSTATTTTAALYARMRQEYADDPEKLADIDRWEADANDFEKNAPKTLPPCPSWCEDAATGHPYQSDSADDDPLTYTRYHEWAIRGGLVQAWVVQEEFNREGVVTYGPVEINGEAVGGEGVGLDRAREALREWQTLIAKAEEAQGAAL